MPKDISKLEEFLPKPKTELLIKISVHRRCYKALMEEFIQENPEYHVRFELSMFGNNVRHSKDCQYSDVDKKERESWKF